jgi:hypothetical protein
MNNFSKKALCVLMSASLLACGGGENEEDSTNSIDAIQLPPSPKFYPAPLTTTNEIAKAAAAIIVANTTFERTIDNHRTTLMAFQPVNSSTRDLPCGYSYFDGPLLYKITTVSNPAYNFYSTIESDSCNLIEGFNTGGGKLIYTCNHNGCLATATDLRYDRIKSESLFQKVNGVWGSKNNISTFKGNAYVYTNGLSSVFYFNDGLVKNPPNGDLKMGKDSFGKIGVSGGNALNCIDGEVSYNVVEPVSAFNKVNGGSIKILSNNVVVGIVAFKSDGSITVKKDGFVEENITQSAFESFCALRQVYNFAN